MSDVGQQLTRHSAANDLTGTVFRAIRHVFFVAVVLVVASFVLIPVQEKPWAVVKDSQPELKLEGMDEALGQGLVLGLMSGLRTVIADLMYIQLNAYWEKRDTAKVEAFGRIVPRIDPRPFYFWFNTSRMIALDAPVWKIREQGSLLEVPMAIQDEVFKEYGQLGIDLLYEALEFHPDDTHIYNDIGQIYQERMKDLETAVEYYKKAADAHNATYYAPRVYAHQLYRLGRKQEAYEYFRDLYPELPDIIFAQKPAVLESIREWEDELNIPLWERLPRQEGEDFIPLQSN